VRPLEADGRVLVIDPGIWSEPRALAGADAVLITHEHVDHVDVLRLRGAGVPVFAPSSARLGGIDAAAVHAGDTFHAAGFPIAAVGGAHARIYGDLPDCPNLGYLIDARLYHPGDALFVPREPVGVVLVPIRGSWLNTAQAIDFVNAVASRLAIGIHDAQLKKRGLSSTNGWLDEETRPEYRWLTPGSAVDVDESTASGSSSARWVSRAT
jgi:L-ascorbate metabolism protein UlaG (beta-lactamase superfamily)